MGRPEVLGRSDLLGRSEPRSSEVTEEHPTAQILSALLRGEARTRKGDVAALLRLGLGLG